MHLMRGIVRWHAARPSLQRMLNRAGMIYYHVQYLYTRDVLCVCARSPAAVPA